MRYQTWDDIRQRYEGLPSDNKIRTGMLNLVEHIARSAIGKSLYPWTNMFELRITQNGQSPFKDAPHLRITPLKNSTLEFRYVDTYILSRQWSRNVELTQLPEHFDKFVRQIRWHIMEQGQRTN